MPPLLRPLLVAAACATAVPTPALAEDRCAQARTTEPALDLRGITSVELSTSLDELVLRPGPATLRVEHCASTEEGLGKRTVSIERRGEVLHIGTGGTVYDMQWFGGHRYAYVRLALSLPADLPVALDIGSGDAAVTGMSRIDVDLGSGDVALRHVGHVEADIGSGDLVVDGATSARVDVGSGDAVLQRIRGPVEASVGSGDVRIDDVGPLTRLEAGSGAIRARGVRGDARIHSLGSGDIELRDVGGRVDIGGVGAGDVTLDGIDGDVVVADEDTLENVDTRGLRGRLVVGG